MRWSILLALAVPAASSHASALQDLFALQRNGLWEAYAPGNPTPLRRYCISDDVRLDAVKATTDAFASLGCKPGQETVKGDAFEISYACSNANPDVGNFGLAAKGARRNARAFFSQRLGHDRQRVQLHEVAGFGRA